MSVTGSALQGLDSALVETMRPRVINCSERPREALVSENTQGDFSEMHLYFQVATNASLPHAREAESCVLCA